MRTVRTILALTLLSAVPVAALAAPKTADVAKAPISVADFAAMLAASTGAAPGLEAGRAAEALTKSGVPLGDPKAPLTEGRLAEILKHYGLEAETANPAATVNRERAESSLVLVNAAGGLNAPGLEALSARVSPGPSTLDDCLDFSRNHGQCVNCCKDLGVAAKACTRFCVSFTGKKSPSEPLP